MPWKAGGIPSSPQRPHTPGRHSRATNGQVASETPLAGLLGLSASRGFVSKVKFRNERVNKGRRAVGVSGERDSNEPSGRVQTGAGWPCVVSDDAQLLFVKDDTKAFVDRSVGSGYPRKFECRTRRNGCRAGGSRMRQLAAGLFRIGILGFVTQNRRAGQPEAGDSTAPDLGPWRSLLWGVGPYRRARRTGRRR